MYCISHLGHCNYGLVWFYDPLLFLTFRCKLEMNWDPTSLLFMNEEGPIPKLPPLETFATSHRVAASSVSHLVCAFQKFCEFLLSHMYTNYFITMDDVRYNRCRENLKGQKQMALEVSRKAKTQSNIQSLKKKKDACRNGNWSERPEDLFRLMAKFASLDVVKDYLENMHKSFYAKFR